MPYIAGKKSDESLVEVLIRRPEWTIAQLEIAIPANHGGVKGDYSFYKMSATEENRIINLDNYVLTWAVNEVTAIDFSPEDSKRFVKIYSDVSEIDGDGIDEAQITLEVWKSDGSGIDTAVTATSKISVLTPNGKRWMKVSVVNGTVTKTFKTTIDGTWIFPADMKRFENVRVKGSRLKIEVIAINIL